MAHCSPVSKHNFRNNCSICFLIQCKFTDPGCSTNRFVTDWWSLLLIIVDTLSHLKILSGQMVTTSSRVNTLFMHHYPKHHYCPLGPNTASLNPHGNILCFSLIWHLGWFSIVSTISVCYVFVCLCHGLSFCSLITSRVFSSLLSPVGYCPHYYS